MNPLYAEIDRLRRENEVLRRNAVMTTWETGQMIEQILEKGERAAALEIIDEWMKRTDFTIDDWPQEWKGPRIQ